MKKAVEYKDIAIIGGGPSGMQAALVAARAGKNVVVFDDPRPPRNGASHGVHNFLGLDGLLVEEVRKIAWEQINAYRNAELVKAQVLDVRRTKDGKFLLKGADGTITEASRVVLCVGYHDVYPDVQGFIDCWADTIIQCPYCDGYENRDRVWGIVPNSENELINFIQMSLNWAQALKVFLPPGIEIKYIYRCKLLELGIAVYEGNISRIHHAEGKIEAVSLESGDKIEVETLLWVPPIKTVPLIHKMAESLGLALDEWGFVKTDEQQQTNVEGLWAAGEVRECCSNALDSAAAGSRAAKAIIRDWHLIDEDTLKPMKCSVGASLVYKPQLLLTGSDREKLNKAN